MTPTHTDLKDIPFGGGITSQWSVIRGQEWDIETSWRLRIIDYLLIRISFSNGCSIHVGKCQYNHWIWVHWHLLIIWSLTQTQTEVFFNISVENFQSIKRRSIDLIQERNTSKKIGTQPVEKSSNPVLDEKTVLLTGLLTGIQDLKCPVTLSQTCCGSKSPPYLDELD